MNHISPRSFFSRLRYIEEGGCQTYDNCPPTGYPIFTQSEIEQVPLKWLKYVLLARLGLRPILELEKDIHRYAIHDWKLAQQCCHALIEAAKRNGLSILLVVKLIPMNRAGQLPNFRIADNFNLDEIFGTIMENAAPEYREIWVCQSIVDLKTSSFAGRLTVPGYQNYGASWLEVVWFNSPRLLESINWKSPAHPSLQAFRPVGKVEFSIRELHIPSVEGVRDETNRQRYLQDFWWLQGKIREYMEKIVWLETIVGAAGARELCLEFKVDNGHFRFIDWDTEVEIINAPITIRKIN